jgi:hypothetical protein
VRAAAGRGYLFSAELPAFRGAGFQTCCVAGFQTRWPDPLTCAADLEVGDTADLEVCATLNRYGRGLPALPSMSPAKTGALPLLQLAALQSAGLDGLDEFEVTRISAGPVARRDGRVARATPE